mmetsp:Transcript_2051/g.4789  ORF Transcript_2051/g.4789 Transcript_2051/m.4789 type:complete len:158 (-) Transcript_2051:263-736(-)
MSGVEVMLAGGLGMKSVAMMKQAALTMKRAARQAFAMAADANVAAMNARTAQIELERYVNGAPHLDSPAATIDGHIERISGFGGGKGGAGAELGLVLAGHGQNVESKDDRRREEQDKRRKKSGKSDGMISRGEGASSASTRRNRKPNDGESSTHDFL